ncbi:NUDIX hydrolase [Pandoraea apista]|uniref:NUDIX hydrolase n=1 Tax=Pandoraea apista TaxID=93218 RepID=UPI00248D6AF5|nr:NUDIX domain-containing protein [Pandoraea apista]
MRELPSSRLLILSAAQRVLLFKFVLKTGAPDARVFWATPGGKVEQGETFADAANRELLEETGIRDATVAGPIRELRFPLQLANGEYVSAVEQYFIVNVDTEFISREGWTATEIEVMVDHKWWSRDELLTTDETIFPEKLIDLLDGAELFDV